MTHTGLAGGERIDACVHAIWKKCAAFFEELEMCHFGKLFLKLFNNLPLP
jgi:hypothetical protein